MYNRYRGNTGVVEQIEEPRHRAPPPEMHMEHREPQHRPPSPPSGMPPLQNMVGELISNVVGELETEDLILMLMLYLLYRESGDEELLIMLGALFLL